MITLTPTQKAAISTEAAEFLSAVPSIPFASLLSPYLASSRRAKGLREDMAAKTAPIEEALIAKHKLKVVKINVASVPVVVIEPPVIKNTLRGKILLNFFGGGFIMGSARERAALTMAAEMGIKVYSVEYSKSPEARYPVARDEALTVYRQLITQYAPENIYGMGSSAGAQILVSMLLLARVERLPMPNRLFLCTPALDLSGAGDSLIANDGRDILPASFLSAMVQQNYQPDGIDLKDPLYSPVYADYDPSFPPTVISVGTRDLCLSNGVRMYWKLRESGVNVELFVFDGMWHGFNWNETLPEAVQARKAIQSFLLDE